MVATTKKRLYGLVEPYRIDDVRQLCSAVLAYFSRVLDYALVDAFSDLQALPQDAEESLKRLKDLAKHRHLEALQTKSSWQRWRLRKGPTYMGIRLDLGEPSSVEILKKFGPYSINAEVYVKGNSKEPLIWMHDSGADVTVRLEETEFAPIIELAGLSGEAKLLPMDTN